MNENQSEFARQLQAVRPSTRHLVQSMLLDCWPNLSTRLDFGIAGQQHYEALYFPIRNQEIGPEALDRALGNGAAITELVRASPHNPYPEVEFLTSWDIALGRASAKPGDRVNGEQQQASIDTRPRDLGRDR